MGRKAEKLVVIGIALMLIGYASVRVSLHLLRHELGWL